MSRPSEPIISLEEKSLVAGTRLNVRTSPGSFFIWISIYFQKITKPVQSYRVDAQFFILFEIGAYALDQDKSLLTAICDYIPGDRWWLFVKWRVTATVTIIN